VKVKIPHPHVKKSKILLGKAGVINVLQEDTPPPPPKSPNRDPFNISNDVYVNPILRDLEVFFNYFLRQLLHATFVGNHDASQSGWSEFNTTFYPCRGIESSVHSDPHGFDALEKFPQTTNETLFARSLGPARSSSGDASSETHQEESQGKNKTSRRHVRQLRVLAKRVGKNGIGWWRRVLHEDSRRSDGKRR
jgi:hypothetical protein